jgi:hypothetical protein
LTVTGLVDGNAIAGDLFGAFGQEMTNVLATCRRCGTESLIAELPVYARGPGAVARCSACDAVLIVLAKIGAECRAHLADIKLQN